MGSHISSSHEKSDQARQILDALRRLVRMLRSTSRESEQRAGINAAQLFVLHNLADVPGLSINELAKRTLTHQSSVSVVVQRLVEAGLVARVEAPEDRRRAVVSLTPTGRARLRRAPDVAQERLVNAIAALDKNDRAALVKGFASLIDELGLAAEPATMLFAAEEPPRRAPRRRKSP